MSFDATQDPATQPAYQPPTDQGTDPQPPSLQDALAAAPQHPMPDVSAAGQPDTSPRYRPGLLQRITGMLEGEVMGGPVQAVVGAVNPLIPQREMDNERQMEASNVKFANEQAAQMATKTAIDKYNLSRLPEEVRSQHDQLADTQMQQMSRLGLRPVSVGPDTPETMKGVYDKFSENGQDGVPALQFVHAPGGKLYVYDLSQAGTRSGAHDILQEYENLSGIPAPSWPDFNNLKPAQRIALVDQAVRYRAPVASANPATNQTLISRYETDFAGYQQRHPDATASNDPNVAWFKSTIDNLKAQGASHFMDAAKAKAQAAAANKPAAPPKVGDMLVGSMSDGSQIAGTIQELQQAGATGVTKLPSDEAKKVIVARQLTAPNGLFAAVNHDMRELDKQGKLGVAASRWSDFMAGTVGSEPEFQKLRTDMGLLATALLQAHVGARGSKDMLKHFEELADYRISDAPTLRSALGREFSYVTEKAMRPKKSANGNQGGK